MVGFGLGPTTSTARGPVASSVAGLSELTLQVLDQGLSLAYRSALALLNGLWIAWFFVAVNLTHWSSTVLPGNCGRRPKPS